jgi:hypothetical protein
MQIGNASGNLKSKLNTITVQGDTECNWSEEKKLISLCKRGLKAKKFRINVTEAGPCVLILISRSEF